MATPTKKVMEKDKRQILLSVQCGVCNRTFKTQAAYTRHSTNPKCTRKGKEQCDQCGVYYALSSIKAHQDFTCRGGIRQDSSLTDRLTAANRKLRTRFNAMRKALRAAKEELRRANQKIEVQNIKFDLQTLKVEELDKLTRGWTENSGGETPPTFGFVGGDEGNAGAKGIHPDYLSVLEMEIDWGEDAAMNGN